MKRMFIISAFALAMPLVLPAQDDMYFVPTKANVEKSVRSYGMPRDTYYSGSDRDVDEYNRRGSYVQEIDSLGNDIIAFDGVMGAYPDSLDVLGSDSVGVGVSDDDYTYTRRMSRFDDYEWTDGYMAGYYDGRSSRWWWYDPWYSWAYYDPWYYGYYGWYDPWFYGWHGYYGWYGHWGWGGAWWGRPHYAVAWHGGGGRTGTTNHGRGTGRRPLAGYSGAASVSHGVAARSRGVSSGSIRNRTFNASERFGTNRSSSSVRSTTTNSTRYTSPTISSGSFGGSRSGGSFGGSRSGGGSGGSRGGFGGRR